MKALIDTNIIIDALQTRNGFFDDAQNVLIAAANGEYKGIIASNAILDIYYIIHRYTKDDYKTRNYISKILTIFDVCDTTSKCIEDALMSKIHDYEDAVMSETAYDIDADYIITRNIKDYRESRVKAIEPQDFLMLLDRQQGEDN